MKKETFKVAIPTNDGINIFKGMLGRALKFYVFEVDLQKNFKLVEKILNPYVKTMQHLKTLDIYDLLQDCSMIISTKIGKNGIQRLEQRNIKLIFREGNIYLQLKEMINSEISDSHII